MANTGEAEYKDSSDEEKGAAPKRKVAADSSDEEGAHLPWVAAQRKCQKK